MTENESFPTEAFVSRDQGRDLMADIIDAYMSEGGEFRSYDLADRIQRRLNGSGWWFVHGGDVERMISQEHPFNARMADQLNAACKVVDRHTHGEAQYDPDWWEINAILRRPQPSETWIFDPEAGPET